MRERSEEKEDAKEMLFRLVCLSICKLCCVSAEKAVTTVAVPALQQRGADAAAAGCCCGAVAALHQSKIAGALSSLMRPLQQLE